MHEHHHVLCADSGSLSFEQFWPVLQDAVDGSMMEQEIDKPDESQAKEFFDELDADGSGGMDMEGLSVHRTHCFDMGTSVWVAVIWAHNNVLSV